jgi:hypothetical protein
MRVISFMFWPLYPGEKGWVGPRTDLDDFEKIKFLTLPELELPLLGRSAREVLCMYI